MLLVKSIKKLLLSSVLIGTIVASNTSVAFAQQYLEPSRPHLYDDIVTESLLGELLEEVKLLGYEILYLGDSYIVEGSIAYNFFVNVDEYTISVEYSNGASVGSELKNSIVQSLASENFDEVIKLVLEYGLALSYETVVTTTDYSHKAAEGRTIGHTVSFSRMSSHLMSDINGSGFTAQSLVTSSGVVTHNPNGTIIPHGVPSVSISVFPSGASWAISVTNVSATFQRIENNRAVNVVGGFNAIGTLWIGGGWVPTLNANFGRTNFTHRIA